MYSNSHIFFCIFLQATTRWAPSYKRSYNHFKWPYKWDLKWVTGNWGGITLLSRAYNSIHNRLGHTLYLYAIFVVDVFTGGFTTMWKPLWVNFGGGNILVFRGWGADKPGICQAVRGGKSIRKAQFWRKKADLVGGFQWFFMFITIWGNDPIWLIFFRWVETTNYSDMLNPEVGALCRCFPFSFRGEPAVRFPGACVLDSLGFVQAHVLRILYYGKSPFFTNIWGIVFWSCFDIFFQPPKESTSKFKRRVLQNRTYIACGFNKYFVHFNPENYLGRWSLFWLTHILFRRVGKQKTTPTYTPI